MSKAKSTMTLNSYFDYDYDTASKVMQCHSIQPNPTPAYTPSQLVDRQIRR